MTAAHYERLSGADLTFLIMEDGRAHMHIGMVSIFDAAPLRLDHGGLDFDRILAYMEGRLHQVPRLRQKLVFVPGIGQPVWVDDPEFNIRFHMRHTALPPPGDIRQLKRLTGRIMSQELDRGKPLWEHWFVDQLEGDRFGLVTKVHHCMVDGVSGLELLRLLLSSDPDTDIEPAPAWRPRPSPRDTTLFVDELRHRATAPLEFLGSQLRRSGGSDGSLSSALPSLSGLRETGDPPTIGPSDTPLNLQIGPHRRFDWTQFSFEEMSDIGKAAGGTVNDVVLAVTAGALGEFLRGRGMDIENTEFRAWVPVDVRTKADGKKMGNKVSGMIADLPIAEPDPWSRLQQVVETTRALKTSSQAQTGASMAEIFELLPPRFMGPFFRRGSQATPSNLAITNVRGHRSPMYILGARQLESYGAVPLIGNQALGIALMSYDDSLFWGFNADWDALYDLHDLVEHVEVNFEELKQIASG